MNLMLFIISLIFYSFILIIYVLFICKLVGYFFMSVRIRLAWRRECAGGFGVRTSFFGIFMLVFLGGRCLWSILFSFSCLACRLLP